MSGNRILLPNTINFSVSGSISLSYPSAPAVGFVPSGSPYLWWKADGLEGLSNNDPVATWVDSSGNSKDALQPNANYQPKYVTDFQAGLPAVYFDGTENMKCDFGESDIGQKSTIFLVFKLNSIRVSGLNMLFDGIDNADRQLLQANTTGNNWSYFGGAPKDTGVGQDTNMHYATIYFGGPDADGLIRFDGTTISGPEATGTAPINGLSIASDYIGDLGSHKSDLYLMEYIYYVGEEEIAANEAGLKTKWGL